jgi:hypothetical protein
MSRSDMTFMLLAWAALTIPFIYLGKDIAKSLRTIAQQKAGSFEPE